ncbi:MAG: hypothetical protein GTO02_17625, partial [Candidatus Dadabacteria bacterium]|nr:hypothetical protein [Candidatus Dadabacteria bacterium]
MAEDLKQLNMSVAEFESEIEKYIIKKDKGKKRRMEAHEAITSQRQKDTKDDTGAKEISTPEVSALKEKYNELVLKRQ